jgi:hypothetical protein
LNYTDESSDLGCCCRACHIHDTLYLLWIGFNTLFGDDVSEVFNFVDKKNLIS